MFDKILLNVQMIFSGESIQNLHSFRPVHNEILLRAGWSHPLCHLIIKLLIDISLPCKELFYTSNSFNLTTLKKFAQV